MVYLKCSCLHSRGQNALIDFNATDTVLLSEAHMSVIVDY